MPERCTCGAQLPPDARFCHKCGKPQREEAVFTEETAGQQEALAPPPIPARAEAGPPRIGFSNGSAVRAALFAGLLAFVCSAVIGQFAQALAPLALGAGGFFAVFLYERRTGQRLSILSGAHLGWLCGVFLFVVTAIALAAMAILLSDPSTVSELRQQMHSAGGASANAAVDQLIKLFQTPSGLTTALAESFLLLSLLPACGGAIGAKLLGRN